MAGPQTGRPAPRGQDWPVSLGDGDGLKQASRSMPQGPRLPTVCRGAAGGASAQCRGHGPLRVRPLSRLDAALTSGRSPAPLRPLFLPHRVDAVASVTT